MNTLRTLCCLGLCLCLGFLGCADLPEDERTEDEVPTATDDEHNSTTEWLDPPLDTDQICIGECAGDDRAQSFDWGTFDSIKFDKPDVGQWVSGGPADAGSSADEEELGDAGDSNGDGDAGLDETDDASTGEGEGDEGGSNGDTDNGEEVGESIDEGEWDDGEDDANDGEWPYDDGKNGGDACEPKTQGYWANHLQDWPIAFPECSESHDAGCFCGYSITEDIMTMPTYGEAWMILASQWVSALLNKAAGVDISVVEETYYEALDLLLTCSIGDEIRDEALALSETLDAFNNGAYTEGCED